MGAAPTSTSVMQRLVAQLLASLPKDLRLRQRPGLQNRSSGTSPAVCSAPAL